MNFGVLQGFGKKNPYILHTADTYFIIDYFEFK